MSSIVLRYKFRVNTAGQGVIIHMPSYQPYSTVTRRDCPLDS